MITRRSFLSIGSIATTLAIPAIKLATRVGPRAMQFTYTCVRGFRYHIRREVSGWCSVYGRNKQLVAGGVKWRTVKRILDTRPVTP